MDLACDIQPVAGTRRVARGKSFLRAGRNSCPTPHASCLHQLTRRQRLAEFGAADALARLPAFALRRLLVIAVPFHVARKPFTLTKTFEPFEKLLNGFVSAWSDFDQVTTAPFRRASRLQSLTPTYPAGRYYPNRALGNNPVAKKDASNPHYEPVETAKPPTSYNK